MNNYDQLTFLILNRILLCFGLRIVDGKKIVFVYRVRDYTDPEGKEYATIIKLSTEIEDAFTFLNMDYKDYQKQQFKSIFEFTEWILDSCQFLTLDILKTLEKEIDAIPLSERTELQNAMDRFLKTVKISHYVLQDFSFLPIMMYHNLRERIVRTFFDSDDVTEQFVNVKLEKLRETETRGKFSPKLIVNWIRPLRSKPSLTGIFTSSFVNYASNGSMNKFPHYLIDTDASLIKKEVIDYYYNDFQKTKAYNEYLLKDKESLGVVN